MKTLYYAVSGSGQACVYTSYPIRDEKRKVWLGEIIGMYCAIVMQLVAEGLITLPPITWKDEPVKLELNINVC